MCFGAVWSLFWRLAARQRASFLEARVMGVKAAFVLLG